MRLLEIFTRAWRYNIFDELVENGATRLQEYPQIALWQEKAQKFFLDNLTINHGSRGGVWVAGQKDSIIVADWKKEKPTKLLIKDISHNPDVSNHPKKLHRFWSKHNQPYLYGSLKIGFGCEGDRYIAQHPDYQKAEQSGVE